MIGSFSRTLRLAPQVQTLVKTTRPHLFSRTISSKMSGLPLKEVVKILKSYAHPALAESWDNVGLLVEPTEPKKVSCIMLTNDLTEIVCGEAVDNNVDMIVSYHPPIFVPLKSVTQRTWKERILAKCLENRIAVYSPHTSLDAIKGGVNDWLATAFDVMESRPITPSNKNPEIGIGRICVLKNEITMEKAVKLVKKKIRQSHVRLARSSDFASRGIRTVAVCAGSGSSVLKGVSADLFVTGEMLHHDVLDAVHGNTSVILTNHSHSERGFLDEILKPKLKTLCGDSVKIISATKDDDPLETA
ncbi:NIF3-like protein 1 [Copidosoma floridanum]|uniref:NIF3-like protein 1 n=1 Tax=Copidosoma floridanum TaxID=29053 RepID=UPI0006C9D76F|nr:NIF3-like protein 1 [Copidosoma floridanum]